MKRLSVPGARLHLDAYGLAGSVCIGLVGATIAFLGTLYWEPVMHGRPAWFVSGDIWAMVDCARRVADGALPYVYQTPYQLYALPLGYVFLAPAVAIGDKLQLVDGGPLPLAHPSMWLVVGPYTALLFVPLLDATRRLAWQLGSRRRSLLSLQVVVAVIAIVPLYTWGHPEDTLALIFVLHGLRLALRQQFTQAAVMLGLAISSKQWALVVLPVLIVGVPSKERVRWIVSALTLPVALAAICLSLDWRDASWHLFAPVTNPLAGIAGHEAIFGRIFGSHTSRYSRAAEVALSIPASLVALRRRPEDRLLVLAALLLCRPLLEPYNYSYYWAPGLVVLAVAVTWQCGGRLGFTRSLVALATAMWTIPVDHNRLLWWLGIAILAGGWVVTQRIDGRFAAGRIKSPAAWQPTHWMLSQPPESGVPSEPTWRCATTDEKLLKCRRSVPRHVVRAVQQRHTAYAGRLPNLGLERQGGR